jgi:hypothetical protein
MWTGGIVVVSTVSFLVGYRYGITLWDWIKREGRGEEGEVT